MTQYIDKSALVAEIEKLSAYLDSRCEQRIIEKILSIIDTEEVKEMDSTDSFVEKACGYISQHQCEYINLDDFKKYMKGE